MSKPSVQPVIDAVEGIFDGRLKILFGRYLPDGQLQDLSDDELKQLLATWRDACPVLKGYKAIVAHACMGLPLQNEVERRWENTL